MLIKTEKLYRNTLLNIQKYIFISTKNTYLQVNNQSYSKIHIRHRYPETNTN